MRTISGILMVLGLVMCVAGASCGKGDEGGAGAASAKPTSSEAKPPDPAAVQALDCAKACTQDGECIKKAGINLNETHQRDCTQSCEMVKGMYDPAKHGKVMDRFLTMAGGQCPR